MPSAVREVWIIRWPSEIIDRSGSAHWLVPIWLRSMSFFSNASLKPTERETFSMVPAPSLPGVAPENRSALPAGTSRVSVVCT